MNPTTKSMQLATYLPTPTTNTTSSQIVKLPQLPQIRLNCPIPFGSFLSETDPSPSTNTDISLSTPTINVTFPSNAIQDSHKQWENSLIINIGGLHIDTENLHRKLAWTWKIKGHLNILPLSHGFQLLSFDLLQDKWKALLHGPCILFGHILSIRLWEPRFCPSTASTDTYSPVWVRLIELPVEYFNPHLLVPIGNSIGTFLGADEPTHKLSKINYARICILRNLSTPLPPSISLEGHPQPLMFEGNLGFCSCCKNINHTAIRCPLSKPSRNAAHRTIPNPPESSQPRTTKAHSPRQFSNNDNDRNQNFSNKGKDKVTAYPKICLEKESSLSLSPSKTKTPKDFSSPQKSLSFWVNLLNLIFHPYPLSQPSIYPLILSHLNHPFHPTHLNHPSLSLHPNHMISQLSHMISLQTFHNPSIPPHPLTLLPQPYLFTSLNPLHQLLTTFTQIPSPKIKKLPPPFFHLLSIPTLFKPFLPPQALPFPYPLKPTILSPAIFQTLDPLIPRRPSPLS